MLKRKPSVELFKDFVYQAFMLTDPSTHTIIPENLTKLIKSFIKNNVINALIRGDSYDIIDRIKFSQTFHKDGRFILKYALISDNKCNAVVGGKLENNIWTIHFLDPADLYEVFN